MSARVGIGPHWGNEQKMAEDVFPKVERVIYGKAPLVEVICQLRFPTDLRVETEPPAAFQQRVKNRLPVLAQVNQALRSPLPPEIAKALEAVIPRTGTVWRFSTEDGSQAIELAKDNLTLLSRNYGRWEEFHGLLKTPLEALLELYAPMFFTRIGLRYRDIIQRSKIGLPDAKWSELLKPHVLGELGQVDIENRAIEVFRTLLLGLPERGAKVRLQHGFAQIEGSDEQSYLIDCDFFVERAEVNHVVDTVVYFNSNAARYFRWCITDTLHKALEPQPVK